MDWWTEHFTGSGSATYYAHTLILETGATVSSIACNYLSLTHYLDLSKATRRWRLAGSMQLRNSIYTNEHWWGFFTNPTAPTITENHFGWRILNAQLYASCGNGANGTQTDTGITYALDDEHYLVIVTEAAAIKYYVDNVLKATITTNLPASGNLTVSCWIQTAGASNKGLGISNFFAWTEE